MTRQEWSDLCARSTRLQHERLMTSGKRREAIERELEECWRLINFYSDKQPTDA